MEYKPLIMMSNSYLVIDTLLELIDKADTKVLLVEHATVSKIMYWLLDACTTIYQQTNCVQAIHLDTSFCSEGYSSQPDAHYAFKADLVIGDENTYNYLTFSVYYIDKFDFSFVLKDKSDKIIDYVIRENLEQATTFKEKYGIEWYSFNAILYKCYCLIRQGDPKTKVIADWERYLLKYGEKASKPIKILKSLLASDEQFNKSLTTKII